MSRKDFESLIKDVADDLNNSKFKTSVDGKAYDFRNGKKVFDENNYPKKLVKRRHLKSILV